MADVRTPEGAAQEAAPPSDATSFPEDRLTGDAVTKAEPPQEKKPLEHVRFSKPEKKVPLEQFPKNPTPVKSVVSARTTTFCPAVTWNDQTSKSLKLLQPGRSSVPVSVELHASHVALHAVPRAQVPTAFRSQTSPGSRTPLPHGISQKSQNSHTSPVGHPFCGALWSQYSPDTSRPSPQMGVHCPQPNEH